MHQFKKDIRGEVEAVGTRLSQMDATLAKVLEAITGGGGQQGGWTTAAAPPPARPASQPGTSAQQSTPTMPFRGRRTTMGTLVPLGMAALEEEEPLPNVPRSTTPSSGLSDSPQAAPGVHNKPAGESSSHVKKVKKQISSTQ